MKLKITPDHPDHPDQRHQNYILEVKMPSLRLWIVRPLTTLTAPRPESHLVQNSCLASYGR